LHEARLRSHWSHPNVVRFIGVCIRPPAICLVSELCDNGSLLELIKTEKRRLQSSEENALRTPESNRQAQASSTSPLTGGGHDYASYQALSSPPPPRLTSASVLGFACDAASALAYLHSFTPPIVHHDIKSSNFVLDEQNRLKLIDFGESRRSLMRSRLEMSQDPFESQGRPLKGTLAWMPPELLAQFPQPSHVADLFGGELCQSFTSNDLSRLLASVDVHDGGDVELIESVGATYAEEQNMWLDFIQNTASRISSSPESSPTSSGTMTRLPSSSSNSSFASRLSSSASNSALSFQSISRTLFQSSQQKTEKIDIFAFGILLWSLFSTEPYPYARLPSFLIPFLVSRGVRPACPPNAPPLLVKLARSCWHQQPQWRPSAAQLVDRLECVRYQLTNVVSARLRTLVDTPLAASTPLNRPQTPVTPPVAATATSVHVREGLFGQFYQHSRSHHSLPSTAASYRPASSFTLPPRTSSRSALTEAPPVSVSPLPALSLISASLPSPDLQLSKPEETRN